MFEKLIKRQTLLFITDIIFINFALFFAMILRFDGRIPQEYLIALRSSFIYFMVVKVTVFYIFGLYRNLWQYASTTELINIAVAVTVGAMLSYIIRVFGIGVGLPRGIYVITWVLDIIVIGGVRFAIRCLQDIIQNKAEGYLKKTLIIGAGEAGAMVCRELERNVDKLFSKPVGFIDDDYKKKGSFIHNKPILGGRDDIPRIIREKNIDEIIIAIPSAPQKTIKDIVKICRDFQVKLKILPGVYELIDEKVSLNKMRDVDIEDLLKRGAVKVSLEEICAYLKGKVVMVTGGGGSIGSELCRQILQVKPRQLLFFGQGENSIYNIYTEIKNRFPDTKIVPLIGSVQDRARLEEVFSTYKPSIVFHAAAHKHVPLMEENPNEAIKNNILGTRNIAETSHKYGVKSFVLISTDKAVNTTNVMGATKRVAEIIVQTIAKTSKTRFCAVRFGNVLGSRGSVIPLFRKQIAAGGPVTVTHPDMVRYFMTIPEAVQLVIQAGAMGSMGEIFVLDMGEPVRIVDLATDLIRLSGYELGKDIDIVFTGIRPGEKLFEEMLTSQEELSTTKNEKIFIAKANGTAQLYKELKSLSTILNTDYKALISYIPAVTVDKDKVINLPEMN